MHVLYFQSHLLFLFALDPEACCKVLLLDVSLTGCCKGGFSSCLDSDTSRVSVNKSWTSSSTNQGSKWNQWTPTISHFTSHEITYRYNVPVPLFVIEVKCSKTTWFCTLGFSGLSPTAESCSLKFSLSVFNTDWDIYTEKVHGSLYLPQNFFENKRYDILISED